MLMKMRSRMQNQKGFTLVELMVVVVILGILVAIAVPVYRNVTDNANRKAVEANLRTIDGAIMQYQAVNNGSSPADSDGAIGNLSGYLQVWPVGPDKVTYDIVSGRAVANKETSGTWWTDTSTAISLPVDWQ